MVWKVVLFFLLTLLPLVSPSKATICRTYEELDVDEIPECASQTIVFAKPDDESKSTDSTCNECWENEARCEQAITQFEEELNQTKVKTADQEANFNERLIKIEDEWNETQDLGLGLIVVRLDQELNKTKSQNKRLEQTVKELYKEVNETKEENVLLDERLAKIEQQLNETKSSDMTAEESLPPSSGKDCNDVADKGLTSDGVYTITIHGTDVAAYCDLTTEGGGWTVIQRRVDGSQDFYKTWQEYVEGFGDLTREFWFGLEKMYLLTTSDKYTLRVDMEDWEGRTAHAEYSIFNLRDSDLKYSLSIAGYRGSAGDSMRYGRNRKFSTKDRDNDTVHGECAVDHKGAWWYDTCGDTNLNGLYHTEGLDDFTSIFWKTWKGTRYSLKRVDMKIRRDLV